MWLSASKFNVKRPRLIYLRACALNRKRTVFIRPALERRRLTRVSFLAHATVGRVTSEPIAGTAARARTPRAVTLIGTRCKTVHVVNARPPTVSVDERENLLSEHAAPTNPGRHSHVPLTGLQRPSFSHPHGWSQSSPYDWSHGFSHL